LCGLTLDHPGVYEVTAITDADDILAESDETNNTARDTVVVVE
jgi:subtilase family serine protease